MYDTTYSVACHKGSIVVFNDPETGIIFYGGGDNRGLEILSDCIILDVGANIGFLVKSTGVETPQLNKYNNPIIRLNWSDGSDFYLPKEFWLDLIDTLREQKKDVIVCCVGGHGRTGTTLAILAGLMGLTEDSDPVEFIRSRYCKKAVETTKQKKYIEEITGLVVNEIPSYISTETEKHAVGRRGTQIESKTSPMTTNDKAAFHNSKKEGGDSKKGWKQMVRDLYY